ncbi:MAG: LysR family transcriptional regulator [Pseudomonadota bacterium]
MDRFDELQTFVRVVEAGGISAAAERMGIAKSAVSRRLQELENRLDAQLLQRTTRRIHLTDAGRDFYQRSLHILDELDEAEQSLQSGQQALGGRIRLNAPLSLGLRHLLPVIELLQGQHPQLVFDLDLDDREINLIEEGVDVLLRVGKLEDSSLVARRLCPIYFLYCAAPDYLARRGEPKQATDLSAHDGIGYNLVPEAQQWQLGLVQGRLLHKPHIRLATNNGDIILKAAEEGMGIAMLPTFICHQAIEQGRLQPVLREHSPAPMALYAIYPSRRHLPQRVRALIDFLVEWFAEGTPWDHVESR